MMQCFGNLEQSYGGSHGLSIDGHRYTNADL